MTKSRLKKGDICQVVATGGERTFKTVIATSVTKNFFMSSDGPESNLKQYPISAVNRILEGLEAQRAYREIIKHKET